MFAYSTFNQYYYDCCNILDIEYNYSEATLKKAYKNKVLKCHPDKGGSTNDFIRVNEAYQFLSSLNIDKPRVSKYKNTIANNNNEFESKSINFKRERINENNINNIKKEKKNVVYKLEIELSDAYFGNKKTVKLNRNRLCEKCKNENLLSVANSECKECKGKKYYSQMKEIQLELKPGIYDGCKIILKGEGEEYPWKEPGDIIFEIHIKANKDYLRKGSDLYTYKKVTIGECLGMENILINLFNKDKFYVNKNKMVINSLETFTVKGKGFKFYDDNSMRGNLHIKFNFSFPTDLNNDQKVIIKNTIEKNYKKYLHNNIVRINDKNKSEKNPNKQQGIFKNAKKFNIKNNNFINKTNLSKSLDDKSDNKKDKKYEIYELVKYNETLINKSYFYKQ